MKLYQKQHHGEDLIFSPVSECSIDEFISKCNEDGQVITRDDVEFKLIDGFKCYAIPIAYLFRDLINKIIWENK